MIMLRKQILSLSLLVLVGISFNASAMSMGKIAASSFTAAGFTGIALYKYDVKPSHAVGAGLLTGLVVGGSLLHKGSKAHINLLLEAETCIKKTWAHPLMRGTVVGNEKVVTDSVCPWSRESILVSKSLDKLVEKTYPKDPAKFETAENEFDEIGMHMNIAQSKINKAKNHFEWKRFFTGSDTMHTEVDHLAEQAKIAKSEANFRRILLQGQRHYRS